MSVKKKMTFHFVLLLSMIVCIWGCFFSNIPNRLFPQEKKEPLFRTQGKEIQISREGKWESFEIKGINLGTGYPGLYPNETGISEDTYYRWFGQIADMNANVVRVYKVQSPEFYTAFLKYNQENDQKLYLIQGIDFRDDWMFSEENIHEQKIKNEIFNETFEVLDAIHGQKMSAGLEQGHLYCYTSDVSDYVLGYMLGVEWDELFIEYTCQINQSIPNYKGTYLYCEKEASPFEIFMAEWADELLVYEDRHWGKQSLISYANWPITDALMNEFEIHDLYIEDQMDDIEVLFDVDHIRTSKKLKTGVFASYNVYPYFPYFLQCGAYAEYVDEKGKFNPYQNYLKELVAHHTCPVVITEYGVSSSRCRAYEDIWRGFNHGGVTEVEQGMALKEMYCDIKKAECAGSIVFTWQDEWYKTTWNEKQLSDPDGRAYWSNVQCAEQCFGIMTFEAGEKYKTHYPDGNLSEWKEIEPVVQNGNMSLFMYSDEKYIHFMIKGVNYENSAVPVRIALDVTPKSGVEGYEGYQYERPVDFIIRIAPEGESFVLVDQYYNVLPFSVIASYHELSRDMIGRIDEMIKKMGVSASSEFDIVKRADGNINGTLEAKFLINETGRLKEGNANPNAITYDSNADYFYTEDAVELRIPWQLLNFYNPSRCMIIDDFHENDYQVKGLEIEQIHAAIHFENQMINDTFGSYKLTSWEQPQFHERLKKSYFILQNVFGEENKYDN